MSYTIEEISEAFLWPVADIHRFLNGLIVDAMYGADRNPNIDAIAMITLWHAKQKWGRPTVWRKDIGYICDGRVEHIRAVNQSRDGRTVFVDADGNLDVHGTSATVSY